MLESLPAPGELTQQFIRLVHQSQGNHTGYFQIVQFHQKRQKYYSTHISDGYFKCKVIFKDKASKQIDKGQIKLFSILHGIISNQGNRILMVFNQLKSWEYPRTVGVIRSWRFQSANNYINGSNLISWFSQQNDSKLSLAQVYNDSDNETVSVTSYCASEINNRKNSHESASSIKLKQKLSTNSLQNHAFSFGVDNEQSYQTLYNGSTQSISIPPTRKEIQSKVKSEIISSTINQPDEKIKKLLIVAESQSENNLSHSKSNENNSQTNRKQKDTFKDRFSRVSQVPSFKEESKQKINMNIDSSHRVRFNSKAKNQTENNEEDQDMFEEMKAEMSKIRQRKLEQFLEQPLKLDETISNKSRVISNSRIVANQQSACKSVSKSRRKSLYDTLMSSDEQGSRSYSNIKPKMSNTKMQNVKPTPKKRQSKYIQDQIEFKDLSYESQQKANSCYKLSNQLSLAELTHGTDAGNRSRKWIAVIIICIKLLQEGTNSKLVVIAEQYKKLNRCGYIFNIVLSNADIQCPFQEGEIYQMSLSGFTVAEPATEQMFVSVELRNNSQDVMVRKINDKIQRSYQDQPHFCYVPLSKIEDLKQGVSLNFVGLVYSYKNISSRKKNSGWANIFTIIDPLTGSTVSFTIFDACKLIYEPGCPVVVYNAITKTYQGKTTISVRNYTFYYFGKEIVYDKFCRFIPQVDNMKRWQEEGNTVSDILELKQKYRQIKNLFEAQSVMEEGDQELLSVQTPISRVTKISPFFFRLLCDSCNKKLNKGTQNCFNCGRRENPLKQLQLSLQISDNTHSLFVEFNHYDSIHLIGEEGERLFQFIDFIMHKRVKLWLQLNPKYRAQVAKMQIFDESEVLKKQMDELKQLIKFL